MGRPHHDNSLTLDNVLARMDPGKTYAAHVVAAKFHVRTAEIRPTLTALVQRGDLEMSHALPKTLGFRKPKVAAPEEPEAVLETSIATPLITVDLTSDLKGYDDEITRRTALCMLTRGSR